MATARGCCRALHQHQQLRLHLACPCHSDPTASDQAKGNENELSSAVHEANFSFMALCIVVFRPRRRPRPRPRRPRPRLRSWRPRSPHHRQPGSHHRPRRLRHALCLSCATSRPNLSFASQGGGGSAAPVLRSQRARVLTVLCCSVRVSCMHVCGLASRTGAVKTSRIVHFCFCSSARTPASSTCQANHINAQLHCTV